MKELGEISDNQVKIIIGLRGLASDSQKQSFLEQDEQSLVLVTSLLSDLEQRSLFPKISDDVKLTGQHVANDG